MPPPQALTIYAFDLRPAGDEAPYRVREGNGFLLLEIDPHRLRTAGGVQHAGFIGPLQRHVRLEAAPSGIGDVVPGEETARILQLLQKIAEGVHDHRPLARRPDVVEDGVQPLDADDFEVPEVDGVVDVAHRVHVTPTDGDHHLERQGLRGGQLESHTSPRLLPVFRFARRAIISPARLTATGLSAPARLATTNVS